MDKISSLPDPILCHVLSFLPIHCAAKTSVLARRWRCLWTSVRHLLLEEKYDDSMVEKTMGFPDMVYRVLLFHDGHIDSLSVCPMPHEDPLITHCQLDAWIRIAIARNVKVLHLFYMDEVWLPECCFKIKTLVELSIESCKIFVKPGAVCLPKLKKLKLLSNAYEGVESLSNLVSGCSAVENLVVERDEVDCRMVCCNLCSPTLKSLVLERSSWCEKSDHEHKLVLDIPAIQFLRIRDNFFSFIWAEKFPSLVEADIWFPFDLLSDDDYDLLSDYEKDTSGWRDTFQFLEKLSNAKSLTFKSSVLIKDHAFQHLNPTFSIATTRFHNLTKLKLQADWYILSELLQSACKLEFLTIAKVRDELKCWKEPKYIPDCLSSSLKHVYIFGFAGGEHELNMVQYILKHGKMLKTVKIHFLSSYHDSKLYMLQRISYFPRGSEICQLILA